MSSTVLSVGLIAILANPVTDEAIAAEDERLFDTGTGLGLSYGGDLLIYDKNRHASLSDRENIYITSIGEVEGVISQEEFFELAQKNGVPIRANTILPFTCIYYNGGDSPIDELSLADYKKQLPEPADGEEGF